MASPERFLLHSPRSFLTWLEHAVVAGVADLDGVSTAEV